MIKLKIILIRIDKVIFQYFQEIQTPLYTYYLYSSIYWIFSSC